MNTRKSVNLDIEYRYAFDDPSSVICGMETSIQVLVGKISRRKTINKLLEL